jgi:hypothetical protein
MKPSQSKLLFTALLSSVTLFHASSAQAAVTGCAGGSTGQALWSDISGTPGFACTIGDKIYSNFSYSSVLNQYGPSFSSGIDPTDQFSFSTIGPGGLIHNLNVQSLNSFINSKVTLTYDVTVVGSSNVLNTYSGNITGDNATLWAMSLAATNAASPSLTQGPPVYPGLNQSATTPTLSFNPNVTSTTFTSTLLADPNGAGVTQFSNRLTQAVPGPLPILGAGAAFGFSRKLRRRVNLAA